LSSIVLEHISKSYGGVTAVRNLSLRIAEGEFVTLLGPSGCGKTTTLRIIAGLEEPDTGEVRIGDRLLFSRSQGVFVPPEKRALGLIFQSYALWPHMTVRRNISLGLEQQRLPKKTVEQRVQSSLEKVHLTGYEERYPSELSGGQQQRVAVARMVAAEPEIFLMDEPLSNLDAMLRIDMRAELKRLHHELEATTVYVTHDQVEALTLSDLIAVMDTGVVRQIGTPEEIYKRPEDLFVARFVGSPRINTIKGRMARREGKILFSAGQLSIPVQPDRSFPEGQIVATVRPEDIEVSGKAMRNWLECRAYSILPVGSETIINVQSNDLSLSVKVNGFSNIRMDDPVWVRLNESAVNFYDGQSEQRIP
jgi:multiple sugar transport system ATP-binding protein